MRPRRATSPALVLAVLVVLVAGVFALTQPPIDPNQGQGFDGVQYHQMAEQLRQGEPVHAEAPFVFRIGTPLAAGVVARTLGTPTLGAFAIVNLLAAAGFRRLRRSPPPADDAELTVPTANEPPGRPGGDEPTDTGTRPDRPRGTIT